MKTFKFIVIIILICFPVFSHMESLPIKLFDESRLAINAYEMSKTGNLMVPTYEYQPDLWNTKPPLMIWLQVLGIKLFGTGELPIRLPSAIAALLTCLFILFFSIRYLKDFWFGAISVIVLISSVGYIQVHAVRTGDYDSLLTLFTTLYSLLFFLYLESGQVKFLYYTFFAIVFAVLSKGIAGMIYLPVLLFLSIIKHKTGLILKSKHFYLGLSIFIFIIGGYYICREILNPGYLNAVWKNEIGGRYITAIEGHKQSFWFYYRMLVDHHFGYWFILIPCGIIVGYFHKVDKIRKLALYSTVLVLFYFLVISLGQTKLEWYNVPQYPFLSILVATFLHFIFTFIRDSKFFYGILKINVLPYLFLFIVSIKPLSETLYRTISPRVFPWEVNEYRITYVLKDALKGKYNLNGYKLLNDGYAANNLFYIRLLNDKGVDIQIRFDWKNFQENDKVIAYQDHVRDYLTSNYSVEVIQSFYNVFYYKINGKLNNE